ncbi:oligoribonuclease isoform X1 [Populus trichocarpa]|uniref:oligoribonuclease isoform X1 n=1 Tax=Populus trichocarpa TaxID=3694 RepID=UPI000D189DC5|nr:oligoribonuclease isoform X1 [Populus trichocarpa]|eukprot:XP_024449954.1 oligoribonuclease isoform X1 [Populus trichocarpa]
MKGSPTCLPSAFKFAVAGKKIKMNLLSNAFSLLEVDAEDDRVNIASSSKSKSSNNRGKSKKKVNDSNLVVKIEKQNEENLVTSSSEVYKMPLVWIDLEMTVVLVAGLNTEVDRILEIACIITDGYLTKSVEGPDLVIHQSKECLDRMGEWCQSHHAASGLTNKVLGSKITERDAEKQVIEFVKRHVGTHTPLIAGNSVYVDFLFLKKYMPDLAGLFSHVVVDVSSVMALCMRWYPQDRRKAPQKENKHRALDDIRESIRELKYYKENMFKPKSKK